VCWCFLFFFSMNGQGRDFLRLWGVLIIWHQRYWRGIMDQKWMCGVLGWFFIFCCVGFLRFGQVCVFSHRQMLVVNVLLSLCFGWLVGCLNFGEMFWFGVEDERGVALAILRGVIDFKREPWPQISDSAKSLVRQMLEPDPKKRLTAEQVLGKYFMVCEARWDQNF